MSKRLKPDPTDQSLDQILEILIKMHPAATELGADNDSLDEQIDDYLAAIRDMLREQGQKYTGYTPKTIKLFEELARLQNKRNFSSSAAECLMIIACYANLATAQSAFESICTLLNEDIHGDTVSHILINCANSQHADIADIIGQWAIHGHRVKISVDDPATDSYTIIPDCASDHFYTLVAFIANGRGKPSTLDLAVQKLEQVLKSDEMTSDPDLGPHAEFFQTVLHTPSLPRALKCCEFIPAILGKDIEFMNDLIKEWPHLRPEVQSKICDVLEPYNINLWDIQQQITGYKGATETTFPSTLCFATFQEMKNQLKQRN